MSQQYYSTLGLGPGASLDEIKKAYRTKAKVLHPDRNKASDAHAQFIALNEAYDYLVALKTGKLHTRTGGGRPGARKRTYTRQRDWRDEERAESRRKAAEYARMRYQAYMQTDQYKDAAAKATLNGFAMLMVALIIFVVAPIVMVYYLGWGGIAAAFLLILLSLTLWRDLLKNPGDYLDLAGLKPAVTHLIGRPHIQTQLLLIPQIFIFVRIGLWSQITHSRLILWWLITIGIGLIITLVIKRYRKHMLLFSVGILPLILCVGLSANYVFSSDPVVETRPASYNKYIGSRGQRTMSETLEFKGNAYADYLSFRFYMQRDKIIRARHLRLQFEEGLFGLRVLKAYEIVYPPQLSPAEVKSLKSGNFHLEKGKRIQH